MKTTFEQARQLVNAMAANYHDETLPVADMRFLDLQTINISNQDFEVLPSAQRLLCNRLTAPHSYLKRCSAELQAHNLNYWLDVEQQQRDTLFCRFDGNKLRAVFTDRYKALDNQEIVQKMAEYGFRGETEVHLNLDQNLMVMKIPDYARMFAVNSSRMTPGIAVSNSEVGVLAFSIEAYFYRLICTNGMIAKTQVASRFRHVSFKALEEFHEIVRQVIHESRYSQERLAVTVERTVDDPAATIESFNRRFLITKQEAEAVTRAWGMESGQTMFHVINAYTRAAQDRELEAESRNKLERVGGQILALAR